MNISFYTPPDNLDATKGYGNAGIQVVSSLNRLGHKVEYDNPDAPIQLNFCPPQYFKFNPGQYTIGYTPWESTELPQGWLEQFNRCDEVWATSEWVAQVYYNVGVQKPIHVYKHGIDSRWEPARRTPDGVVKFLHVGEPALRKGGQMALDAFREVFGDREDVHLTIKAYSQHYLRVWKDGEVTTPEKAGYKNVTIITENLPVAQLRQLYYDHHVLVYPSYGEGFGFIPLQALASGMPVICTDAWAPYQKYLLSPLAVSGRWDRSIWSLHPGNVYYPNYPRLKNAMELAVERIDRHAELFFAQAQAIHDEFDWLKLTERAFAHLV